jgi:hypothetical protein
MPDIGNVSRKPLFEAHRGGIHFGVNQQVAGLWVNLRAGKIFDSAERDVVLQLLFLYVVAQGQEESAQRLPQILKLRGTERQQVAKPFILRLSIRLLSAGPKTDGVYCPACPTADFPKLP